MPKSWIIGKSIYQIKRINSEYTYGVKKYCNSIRCLIETTPLPTK